MFHTHFRQEYYHSTLLGTQVSLSTDILSVPLPSDSFTSSVGFFSTFKTPLCAAPPPFSTPLYCFRPPDTGLLGLSPPSPNLRTRFLDPSMSLLSMATSPSTVIDLSPSFSTVSNCTSYPRSRLLDLSPPASSTSLNPPPLSGWISTLDRAAGGHSNRQRHLGLEEGLEVHMNNGASRW